MRRLLCSSFALPLSLSLAACGGSGKTCTITSVNGEQTLVCPDGTSTTVSGTTGTSGANGTTGQSAHATLVAVSVEAAGTNCASGGQSVTTGVDANDNGMLDPSEVVSTSYVCAKMPTPETIEGDVTIVNSADAAALTGVKTITGALTVYASTGVTAVSLPTLERVGSLEVDNFVPNGGGPRKSGSGGAQPHGFPSSSGMLMSFSAPHLAIVDHSASFNDGAHTLATIELPALVSVDSLYLYGTKLGDLSSFPQAKVTSAISLQSTQITSLGSGATSIFATFHGELDLSYNQGLTDVGALASLTSLAQFNSYADAFTTLSFAKLTNAGALYVRNESALTSLSAPVLTVLTNRLDARDNAHLTSVSVPQLTQAQGFYIAYNPVLSTVVAPLLANPSYVTVVGNAAYSSCAALALVEQTGNGNQYGNMYDPSCL